MKMWLSVTLLLIVASLLSCSSQLDPVVDSASSPASEDAVWGPEHDASATSGSEQGEIVRHRGVETATAIYESVPKPRWSRFDKLEAPRIREPLTTDSGTDDGPVILLMLDTTRVDHLGAFGYERETTPNLTAFAEESIRFSRFYSNAAWTRPSVASMMTSKYRSEHGIEARRAQLQPEAIALAEIFDANDYETGAVVGNQTVAATHGFDQGFSTYLDVWEELKHDPPAHDLVARANKWIDEQDDNRWFLWLFVVDPHDPYNPGRKFDKWEKKYRGRPVTTPGAEYARLPHPRYVDRMRALYDAEILEMDDAVGQLFDHLKAKGIWDSATIVVVGDHGEAFGENNCFRHPYHMWEATLHIPLMIKTPALKSGAGMVEDRLFQGVDLAPTLVELHGLNTPTGWEPRGVSILETLTGPITDGWDRVVFAELQSYGLRRFMARWGDWKYLRFDPSDIDTIKRIWSKSWKSLATANHTNTREYLFNIAEDPDETKNVKEDHPEVMKYLRASVEQLEEDDDNGELSPEMMEELRSLGYVD